MAYWGHKINREAEKAYEFEYPLYRKSASLTDYAAQFKFVRWHAAKIESLEISDGAAKVALTINRKPLITQIPNMPSHDMRVEEKWLKVDGTWYHVPK